MISKASLVIGAVLFLYTFQGYAQNVAPQTIETTGEAEMAVDPDYVEFTIEKTASVPSLARAFEIATEFETNVKALLSSTELTPSEIEFQPAEVDNRVSSKAIRPPQAPEPLVTTLMARVRFPLADMGKSQEQQATISRIYEKLRSGTTAFQAKVLLPKLGVFDPQLTEKSVIAKAIEAAYPHADAVAETLRVRIIAVHKVTIQDVTWQNKGESSLPFRFTQLACRAKVCVTYITAATL